ncbi:EpsG family protein [Kosakonia cowanii]
MQKFFMSEESFIKTTLVLVFLVLLLVSPVWFCILLLSLAVYFSKIEYKIPCVIFLWFFASFFIANIDQAGDVLNYQVIYDNYDSKNYMDEYSSEPFILYFYSFFHFFNASFEQVLFIQAAILNALALFVFVRVFGVKGLKYYPALIMFPQYIQQLLFLSRQSLAIMIFLTVFISYRHVSLQSIVKKLVAILLALTAHSVVAVYSIVYFFSSLVKRYVTWKFLLVVFTILIIFPLNIDSISQAIGGMLHYSGSLDRKIRFYLVNSDPENVSSFSLLSTSVLPLHVCFFLIVVYLKKYKRIAYDNSRVIIFFLFFYFLILLIRNYSLLPARFSLVILLVVPFFYYYMTLKLYSEYKYSNLLNDLFFIYIIVSYFKFLITNDYGDYNITLLNKGSLSQSVMSIMVSYF